MQFKQILFQIYVSPYFLKRNPGYLKYSRVYCEPNMLSGGVDVDMYKEFRVKLNRLCPLARYIAENTDRISTRTCAKVIYDERNPLNPYFMQKEFFEFVYFPLVPRLGIDCETRYYPETELDAFAKVLYAYNFDDLEIIPDFVTYRKPEIVIPEKDIKKIIEFPAA